MKMLKKWRRAGTTPPIAEIKIDTVVVAVTRKRIKNIYLRVDRRNGRAQLSASVRSSDEELTAIVRQRIDWIKRHQAIAAARPPALRPRYISGETHLFLGEPLQLEVIEREGRGSRVIRVGGSMQLHIHRRSRFDQRQRAVHNWYRRELQGIVPPLVEKWQPVMGVQVAEWHVKRMRTRWGTCNIRARRVWLSLELVGHPIECLEYVVVHEMVHLLERSHNARFKSLMTKFLPDWRARQRTLGRGHAGHYKQGDGDHDQIDDCP
jgi:predicted metal-dependent hydrolase